MKSKSTATIFAFCFGGIGIHHYYLGNTTKGILYSVFCITFIPALLAIIDFIVLATMSDNDFHRKYNANYIDHSEEDLKKLSHLEKIHDLKEKGILSEEEYNIQKQKLSA